ncbi:CxxH/CxxC protein [Aneurinibacillus sp. Ricciae_BoGa-3]|uniref:CxxH/CxxC protein n=1 Tax=Aneurinibacillus sp. Ricciae_BoGa-3 TaxID=3022697 RepID=UPI0023413C9F|nr:CxxH/CxxC protein [Aneurinibacillus sp. Ricciae_BoGa-3]WCK54495.1 CxxH/CxxC protein [Aneurinibacillus sp. Ricciae_BoGa-3]
MDPKKKEYLENGGENVEVCCEEHMEVALEDFIDEFEAAPDVYMLKNVTFTAWKAPEHCAYCTNKPKYIVV